MRTNWLDRNLKRRLIPVAVLVAPLVIAFGSAAPARANSPVGGGGTGRLIWPELTLRNGTFGLPGQTQWAVSGSGYASGLSDVKLWVTDVTGGGSSLLESQDGLTTTTANPAKLTQAGLFSAAGAVDLIPTLNLGVILVIAHPMLCGHQYQAETYDPDNSVVSSNVLTEPACT